MGLFDYLRNTISSSLSSIKEEEEKKEEEKKKQFRERLGRPSTTGLQGASSRTADEWQKAKVGQQSWLGKLTSSVSQSVSPLSNYFKSDDQNNFKKTWDTLDLADKKDYLKHNHLQDTSILSPYEKALNNYYSPYIGADGRNYNQLTDAEKDGLFRDQLFDLEIGKLYDRARTPDGVFHYAALPERLQELEKERLQKEGKYDEMTIDAAKLVSGEKKEFSGTDIFPYHEALTGQERDLLLKDLMIDQTFKNHPLYQQLKLLHPQVQQKLYDNPEVLGNQKGEMIKDADLEADIESYYHPILGNYRQVREKLAHAVDRMNQSAGSDPHGLWSTFLTGKGNEGQKAMVGILSLIAARGMAGGAIKGAGSIAKLGKEATGIGIMTAANVDWNSVFADITGNDEASILREAEAESLYKINESIEQYKPKAKSILDDAQLNGDNGEQVDNIWNDLTAENNQWKTFKNKEITKAWFNESKKKDLISETLLVSNLYGEPQALKYFNDKLNDEIAELQGGVFKGWQRTQSAVAAKMMSSFAEGILSTELLWQWGKQAVGAAIGDDELVQEGGQAVRNLPLGLRADGTRAPFLLNLKYWDGVDKQNTLDPDYIDNVNYGIYEPGGKDFTKQFAKYYQENKGKYANTGLDSDEITDKLKEDYIIEQENTGIYNGTGISEYVRTPKTGEEHSVFSANTIEFGAGMMGYTLGQLGLRKTTEGIGKAMNAIGDNGLPAIGKTRAGVAMQTIGRKFGEVMKPITNKLSLNPVTNIRIRNWFNKFGKSFHDKLDANLTASSISFGYGFGAMDDIQKDGIDDLRSGIQQRMAAEDDRINFEQHNDGIAEMWYSPMQNAEEEGAFQQRYRQFRQVVDGIVNTTQAAFEQELQELAAQNPQMTQQDAENLWKGYSEKENRQISQLREEFIDNELRNFHKDDLKKLRDNSIKGFYTQAAIEQYRMATFMPKFNRLVFRDQAQRMGRLANRLPFENTFKNLYKGKLASTIVDETTGSIVRNTGKLRTIAEKVTNVGRQVWAGAYSNYMDDVTSAYTKGFYINDYNNYLATKYNPDTWGYEASNLSNFMAGMNSAQNMMTDPQALYDGLIGGVGTAFTFLPYGAFGLAGHVIGEGSFKKGWQAYTTDPNTGRNDANYYRDKSLEHLSKGGEKLIEVVGKELKDRGIPSIFSASLLTNWTEILDDIKAEVIDTQDGKDGLGFALAQLIHDSVEELGENENSNPYAALYHNMQRLAKGRKKSYSNIGYESTADLDSQPRGTRWAAKMATALDNFANDAVNTEEEANTDGIRQDDIDAYLQDPVNQERIEQQKDKLEEDYQTEEGEVDHDTFIKRGLEEFAAERIQKNAQKFLDFYNNYHKNLKITRQYFGKSDDNDRDAALQMAYNMTMYNRWKKRLQSVNKRIEGTEEWNQERNNIVQFKNIGYINRKLKNIEKEIKTAQTKKDKYEKMRATLHKARKHGDDKDAYNAMQELFNMTGELNAEELKNFKQQWQAAVKGDNPSITRLSVVRDAERRMTVLVHAYDNIINYNKDLQKQTLYYKDKTLEGVDPALIKEAEEAYNELAKLKKPEIKVELKSTPKSKKFLKEMEERHPQKKETQEEENNNKQEKETPVTGLEEIKNKKEVTAQVKGLVEYDKNYVRLRKKMDENVPVITAEEMSNLNPADRATLILDRNEYSREQQKEIDRYLELIESERKTAIFFNSENQYDVEDVLDAGILYERLQNTDKLLKEMIKSPVVYAHYSRQVASKLLFEQQKRYMASPQFRKDMEIVGTISEIISSVPNIDGSNLINNQNIINGILDIISKYKQEVKDWNSPTQLLEVYDAHSNEIMALLDNDENTTRDAISGKGLLPMKSADTNSEGINSIRDLFEATLNNYLQNQKDKEDRKNPSNAPERQETYNESQQREDEKKIENGESEIHGETQDVEEEVQQPEQTVDEAVDEIINEEDESEKESTEGESVNQEQTVDVDDLPLPQGPVVQEDKGTVAEQSVTPNTTEQRTNEVPSYNKTVSDDNIVTYQVENDKQKIVIKAEDDAEADNIVKDVYSKGRAQEAKQKLLDGKLEITEVIVRPESISIFTNDGFQITGESAIQLAQKYGFIKEEQIVNNEEGQSQDSTQETQTEESEVGKEVSVSELKVGDKIKLADSQGKIIQNTYYKDSGEEVKSDAVHTVTDIVDVDGEAVPLINNYNGQDVLMTKDFMKTGLKVILAERPSESSQAGQAEESQQQEPNTQEDENVNREKAINDWLSNQQVTETIKQYCVGATNAEEAIQMAIQNSDREDIKQTLSDVLKFDSTRKIIEQFIVDCNKHADQAIKDDTQTQSPKSNNEEYNNNRKETEETVNKIQTGTVEQSKVSILGKYAQKAKSAIISLLNPFRFRKSNKNLYNNWIQYVGEPHAAMKKLGEISKMDAKDRPPVYFYVPKGWNESLAAQRKGAYDQANDLPIIMVVEDAEGFITVKNANGEDVHYTAIGLAPSSNINTDISIEKLPYGNTHWTTARQLGITTLANLSSKDDGALIKDEDGNNISASINNIRFITPQSVPTSSKQDVKNLALDYLHYNGSTSVFSEDEIKNQKGGFFEQFMRAFLRNLKVRKRKSQSHPKEEIRELVYGTEGGKNPLLVSHWDLHELNVKVNGQVYSIRRALSIAAQDASFANNLFRNSPYLNRIRNVIAKSFNAASSKPVLTQVAGRQIVSQDFVKALKEGLKALDYYLYTSSDAANKFSFTVKLDERKQGDQTYNYLQLGIKIGEGTSTTFDFVDIKMTADNKPLITDIVGTQIIKSLLYEGKEGNGAERNVNIAFSYDKIAQYKEILDGTSTLEATKQNAIINEIEDLFKEGIFTMFHEDFKHFDVSVTFGPKLMAQDTSQAQVEVVTVAEPDNATTNQPVVQDAKLPPVPETPTTLYDRVMNTVKTIVKNSQKRFADWKARHSNTDINRLSQSFSATSVASALSGDYFNPNSPWALPSRVIGNTGDSFLREFFKGSLKRENYTMLDDEAYTNMVKHLEVFKESLIANGENYINTEETILRGNTKVTFNIKGVQKTIELQGENHFDMFTVDDSGKIRIYDFKTFRSDGSFIDNIFTKYQVQLNAYRNALKQEYPDLEVASLHIIPIEVFYKDPNEASYSLDDNGNLMQDGNRLVLDKDHIKMGMMIDIRTYIREYSTNINSTRRIFLNALLEGLGFNNEQLQFISKGKMNNKKKLKGRELAIYNEINKKITIISTIRTHSLKIPIKEDTSIDFNSLTDKAKNEIIRLATAQNIDLQELGIIQNVSTEQVSSTDDASQPKIDIPEGKIESNKSDDAKMQSDLNLKNTDEQQYIIIASDKTKRYTMEQKEKLDDDLADCL